MLMDDNLDVWLAKSGIIKTEQFWEKLINIDSQRSILFPCNYHKEYIRSNEILFHELNKIMSDYKLAMKYLNEQYGSPKVDYKLYYPSLLRNNGYIDHYREMPRDFAVEFFHTIFKASNMKETKKW